MMMAHRSTPTLSSNETSDMDRFINLDPSTAPTPDRSPATLDTKPASIPLQDFSSSSYFPPLQPSSQQTFAAPSHQYGLYQQHNGLPVGALAVTQAGQRPLVDQQYYTNPSVDGYNMANPDDIDLGIGFDSSYNTGLDMDMDFSSTSQNYVHSIEGDFVDPSAIGGQEESTPAQPPMRAYPGMHQQRAALAEAQKQKQREASSHQQKPPQRRDPVVEDRISRILNQMRHSSVTSSNEDDSSTQNTGNASGSSRAKKDEEDMDEDERLLASEEGKKLSSKERRQLRNKVSARAFRSRRKEYIGQLEGEIAQKATENDQLRTKNQELMKENAQLHDLTRTLLSSSAFSEFLNELGGLPSATTNSSTPVPSKSSAPKAEQPAPSAPKDVNPTRVASQQEQNQQEDQPFVGLTMVPEHTMDLNAFDNDANAWNGMGSYDLQVYSVTSLPESPFIEGFDLGSLSGKPFGASTAPYNEEVKKVDCPSKVESMPEAVKPQAMQEQTDTAIITEPFDESDPEFALFADSQSAFDVSTTKADGSLFGEIGLEKAFGRVELILEDERDTDAVGPAAIERFQRACATLEALSQSISNVIPA